MMTKTEIMYYLGRASAGTPTAIVRDGPKTSAEAFRANRRRTLNRLVCYVSDNNVPDADAHIWREGPQGLETYRHIPTKKMPNIENRKGTGCGYRIQS